MRKDTGNALGGPAIVLVGIAAILDVILFHFMFKFADEGNLFMVLLTALLIVFIAMGTTKILISISRHDYGK